MSNVSYCHNIQTRCENETKKVPQVILIIHIKAEWKKYFFLSWFKIWYWMSKTSFPTVGKVFAKKKLKKILMEALKERKWKTFQWALIFEIVGSHNEYEKTKLYTTLNFFCIQIMRVPCFTFFPSNFFSVPFLHSTQLLLRKVVKLEKEIVAKIKRKKTCSYSCFEYWILLFSVDKWIKGLFGNNLLGFVRNENTKKDKLKSE